MISKIARAGNLLGMLNDSRNVGVYFTSHFVQKVGHLDRGGLGQLNWARMILCINKLGSDLPA